MIIEYIFAILIKSLLLISCVALSLWLCKEFSMGICQCQRSMKGKVALITGGNEGIGFETVLELAKRGAKIIIGCQNIKNVRETVLQRVPNAEIDVMWLDLSSKDRIQHFVKEVRAKYHSINVLINNAGMIPSQNAGGRQLAMSKGGRTKTADGLELVMGANYFGHVLLNHLLLDLVRTAGNEPLNSTVPADTGGVTSNGSSSQESFEMVDSASNHLVPDRSRIIIVASPAALTPWANQLYSNNNVYFDDGAKNPLIQYSKSKLAQIMYASHLAKVLHEENSNTIVTTLYPGFVRYDMVPEQIPRQYHTAFQIAAYIFGKNLWQGAQTSIHLSVNDFSTQKKNDISGMLFVDCRPNQMLIPKLAKDRNACQKLWNETVQVLGLSRQ